MQLNLWLKLISKVKEQNGISILFEIILMEKFTNTNENYSEGNCKNNTILLNTLITKVYKTILELMNYDFGCKRLLDHVITKSLVEDLLVLDKSKKIKREKSISRNRNSHKKKRSRSRSFGKKVKIEKKKSKSRYFTI